MLSDNEIYVLSKLRENARIKAIRLQEELDLSTTSVISIIRQLRRSVIKRMYTEVDFQYLGYPVRVFFTLKYKSSQREVLLDYLLSSESVNNLQRISSGYFVDALFSTVRDAHDFTEELQTLVKKVNVHYLMKEVKFRGFLRKVSKKSLGEYTQRLKNI